MITVFTPTYNRKYKIGNLYNSLLRQSDKRFVWMIVDDGSSDGTDGLVTKWIDDGKINIEYFYQNNAGKHRAHNYGVNKCKTDWFICVDSDDYLTDDAIGIFYSYIQTLNEKHIGIVFPKYECNKGLPNKWFSTDTEYVNIYDINIKLKCMIETAILIKTEYLKRTLFPEIEGEKYMGEEIVYNRLQRFGYFKPVYEKVYCYEYLEDGLTKQTFNLWKNCPIGTLRLLNTRYSIVLVSKARIKDKSIAIIKCIMNINALCIATNKKIFRETPNKVLSFLLYIPALIFKKIRYKL